MLLSLVFAAIANLAPMPSFLANEALAVEIRGMKPAQVDLLVDVAALCNTPLLGPQFYDCDKAVRRAAIKLAGFKSSHGLLGRLRKNLFRLSPQAVARASKEQAAKAFDANLEMAAEVQATLATFEQVGSEPRLEKPHFFFYSSPPSSPLVPL